MQRRGDNVVVGSFRDRDQAEQSIGALRQGGFRQEDIGTLRKDEQGRGANASAAAAERDVGAETATGAVTGGLLGGLLGALAGGLAGALMEVGVPENEERYYDERIRSGGTIVTVGAGDRSDEARGIMAEYGGDLQGRSGGGEGRGAHDEIEIAPAEEIVVVEEVVVTHAVIAPEDAGEVVEGGIITPIEGRGPIPYKKLKRHPELLEQREVRHEKAA